MPANRVTAAMGYTVNMGDFESLRIDFGVETDVGDNETTRAAMERAKKLVEDVLGEEVVKANQARGGRSVKRGSN